MLISVGWVATPSSREEPEQVRVGALVVHDEPGVERGTPPVGGGDVVGVRVPAEPAVGLVQRDVVVPLEQVRGGQAGDAGADHGRAAAGLAP